MVTMPTHDSIAGAVRDNYGHEGMLLERGLIAIVEAIAKDLVPGEDLSAYLGNLSPSVKGGILVETLNGVLSVTDARLEVAIIITPAVAAVAQRAQVEYWTQDELVKAVEGIAELYRPRVQRIAALPGL
jgi:hypothetical protein